VNKVGRFGSISGCGSGFVKSIWMDISECQTRCKERYREYRNSYVLPGTIILNVCIQTNNGSIDHFVYGSISIQNFVTNNGTIDGVIDIRRSYNFVIIFSIRTATDTKLYKCCRKRCPSAFGCTVNILA